MVVGECFEEEGNEDKQAGIATRSPRLLGSRTEIATSTTVNADEDCKSNDDRGGDLFEQRPF